jgi:hypothetical protein
MYKTNDSAFLSDVMGMPSSHAEKFKLIARMQKCIVMVRATGPTCLTLLEEGYDTKGFRIHGKSCDWGPMAGFVMRDPRLNKKANLGAEANRNEHHKALSDSNNQGWKAATTPLKISNERINWLRRKGIIRGLNRRAYDRWDGQTWKNAYKFNYSFIKDPSIANLWGVFFNNENLNLQWKQEKGPNYNGIWKSIMHPKYEKCEAMIAMSNPSTHRLHPSDNAPNAHHNAITGDYDMFALWPDKNHYDAKPGAMDHRPLGTVHGSGTDSAGQKRKFNIFKLEANFVKPWIDNQGEWHKTQESKIGNVTPRIYMVSQLINSAIGFLGTSPGRNLLWHSDEAARPGVDAVDLPMGAFHPDGKIYGIEKSTDGNNLTNFKAFINFAIAGGYHVNLSQGWVQSTNHANVMMRLNRNDYSQFIPEDGVRTKVENWYNA